MERYPLLFLSCIVAGFALLKVPLDGFLFPLSPLVYLFGQVAILLFSCVLIIQGLMSLLSRRF
ncbi:hypothetical protein [Litchfieldia salsa]|uniref:Uncharacterized protein n=1 Tax=Litchfieldia salsa TaxID=930152 RepID=A0A1H0QDQ4_9BACI|nr:hypothetical protein [Litchfieldia salsa]SDP15185.1 hypothetical protein SAMN05216565_101706 [Litchfieldia salsa]